MEMNPLSQAQFDAFLVEFRQLKANMVTKHDVFQVVILVQTAYFAIIAGTVVVLGAVGLF